MSRIFSFIFILIILTSCYNENKKVPEEPSHFLSEDELVEIMTDVQLAEAILSFDKSHKSAKKEDFKDSVYKVIFNKYNITAEQLTDNITYYNNDPKNMERLFEVVMSNLSQLQSEIQLEAIANDSSVKNDVLAQNDSLMILGDTLLFSDTLVLIDALPEIDSFPKFNWEDYFVK